MAVTDQEHVQHQSRIARLEAMTRQLQGRAGKPLTALPPSPVDGQEFNLQSAAMAALGVMWKFRYRQFQADGVTVNPSIYKWEFVGGAPLQSNVDVAAATAGSGSSYSDLVGSPGPDLVVPLAGDYDVHFGAVAYHPTNMVNSTYGIAVGVSAQPAISAAYSTLANGSVYQPAWSADRLNGVPLGTTLRMRYAYVSIAYNVAYRRMRVLPIRVG